MDCPQCQHENPAGAGFCNACGAKLEVVCPACSQVNPPGSRFCNACGHNLAQPPAPTASVAAPSSYTPKHLADKILTARSALEGERKQVTVLFADTAGFTALARDLDPRRHYGAVRRPHCHEDGPRRAVHAALGIQRAIQDFGRALQAQRGLRLQMRIGLNTALVVVGRIGDDLRMDYTAVGDTTNLAARLQQLAPPGTVMISEATHKLVAGYFETQDLGEHAVKGHTEPERVYLKGDEVAQQFDPWPEPRGHSLVKAGLAHLYRGEHGPAEACLRRAEALLEADTWLRWRWQIALLHACGELALTQGHPDQAWTYAMQSLELATQTDSRKHVARAQRLQGEVLTASGRLEEAAPVLTASIHLAEHIQTPREVWLGKAALGKVLARLGRDKEAEAQFTQSTQIIEAIAANLQTPRLRHSFLNAAPVLEVYAALGHRPPPATL